MIDEATCLFKSAYYFFSYYYAEKHRISELKCIYSFIKHFFSISHVLCTLLGSGMKREKRKRPERMFQK